MKSPGRREQACQGALVAVLSVIRSNFTLQVAGEETLKGLSREQLAKAHAEQ